MDVKEFTDAAVAMLNFNLRSFTGVVFFFSLEESYVHLTVK